MEGADEAETPRDDDEAEAATDSAAARTMDFYLGKAYTLGLFDPAKASGAAEEPSAAVALASPGTGRRVLSFPQQFPTCCIILKVLLRQRLQGRRFLGLVTERRGRVSGQHPPALKPPALFCKPQLSPLTHDDAGVAGSRRRRAGGRSQFDGQDPRAGTGD